MKIISSDTNTLIAEDKAISQMLAAVIITLVGLGLMVAGLVARQLVLGLVGLVVFALGAIFVVTTKQRRLTIDKATGQITFRVKGITGSSEHPYAISDVAKLQLVSEVQTTATNNGPASPGLSFDNSNRSTTTSQQTHLQLVLKNGESIDLADGSRNLSSMAIFSKVPNQGVGKQIADFLGVAFEQVGAGTIDQAVTAVRDAITGQNAAPSVVAASQDMPPVAQPAPAQLANTPPSDETPQ
jgi:hypothetical protein